MRGLPSSRPLITQSMPRITWVGLDGDDSSFECRFRAQVITRKKNQRTRTSARRAHFPHMALVWYVIYAPYRQHSIQKTLSSFQINIIVISAVSTNVNLIQRNLFPMYWTHHSWHVSQLQLVSQLIQQQNCHRFAMNVSASGDMIPFSLLVNKKTIRITPGRNDKQIISAFV